MGHRGWKAVWADPLTRQALILDVIVVGEALGKVSPAVQGLAPEIPWPAIRGMRNRLIHEYWLHDEHIIANAIANDFPSLISAVGDLIRLMQDPS
ncbi:DUF86 domain-containing protein [Enterovirga sp. CN4-39]|uniref:HepT-like ribonuclease domain-containing protein n=1 Tax=Enterovirga sp. CN4-39 TaxID=3400910 RepID=UPI003C049F1E